MAPIRFTSSQRGGQKLIFKGFMYTKHRPLKSGQTEWRCDLRKKMKCNATILLSADRTEVLKEKEHTNHTPDWGRVGAAEAVVSMKNTAKGSRESTATIVQRHVKNVGSETSMKLPKKTSLARAVRRVKQSTLPEDPKDLRDLQNIDEMYTHVRINAIDYRWLLHFDPDADDKMMVFSTNRHLRYLARSDYWIMDGTFKSAPNIFYQLYSIHGNVHDQWVPLVLVLLERKTKQTYTDLFNILKEEAMHKINKRLDPTYISLDYEQAAIQAVLSSFQNTDVAGCLFHLGQSFWRKLQNVGLAEQYQEETNSALRKAFHSLVALAFLQVDDVPETFDELRHQGPAELEPVFKYVEETYIRGKRRGRGRTQPSFPPEWWNCHSRALGILPRTTNTVEAWHRRLNSLMGKSHPSLYYVLEQLQMEVQEVDRDIERLSAGHSPAKKRKNEYEERDKRIQRIVGRYNDYRNNGEVLEFLKDIGHSMAGTFMA